MKHVPWCDVEGVISVMTPKELDYVECLWEAWKPHEIKQRTRFMTLARGKLQGLTLKSMFKSLGMNYGQSWRWNSYRWEARALCRARRQFWESGILAEYTVERERIKESIAKNKSRIEVYSALIKSWKSELRAQEKRFLELT